MALRRSLWTLGVLAIVVLAFGIRTVGLERIWLPTGEIVFASADSYYHARRALFSFHVFPLVLFWDPLLNYPDGAAVPWPPLYDLLLASIARPFGDAQETFERVVVWLPPIFGAISALTAIACARVVAGRREALLAGAICALMPPSIGYSYIGNIDHHAFAGMLGAFLLALVLAGARERTRGLGLLAVGVGLAVTRAALLLTWPGSVVYIGTGDALLAATAIVAGRRDRAAVQGVSALASALLVAPIALVSGTSMGGAYSTVVLSRLHPLALFCLGAGMLGFAALEWLRPAGSAWARALRAGVLAALVGWFALAPTGVGAELLRAQAFLEKADGWGLDNVEQTPLFKGWVGSIPFAVAWLGFFAYLLPLAPLVCVLRARDPSRRAPLLVLAGWTAVFAVLVVAQHRFGNDFAVGGSVAFALLLTEIAGRATARLARPWLATALAYGLVVAVLWVPLASFASGAVDSVRNWENAKHAQGADWALGTSVGSLLRFAQEVRRVTPETEGFYEPGHVPAYGVLVEPNIGHLIHYGARRATPADNFGPYAGEANFEASMGFFGLADEATAVAEMRRLRTPYVVSVNYGAAEPRPMMRRLQVLDGLGREDWPRLEHFRLVTEGPAGGRTLFDDLRGEGPPYKLYEAVAGAELEAKAPPGTPMRADVEIHTPTGRRFRYVAETEADAEGVARLRLPYATRTATPAAPISPWRVRIGDRSFAVPLTEDEVRAGARIPVGD